MPRDSFPPLHDGKWKCRRATHLEIRHSIGKTVKVKITGRLKTKKKKKECAGSQSLISYSKLITIRRKFFAAELEIDCNSGSIAS